MRGRTNTVTTTASKASVSTSKRLGGGVKPRTNSDVTRASSGATSIIIGFNPQESYRSQTLKQITEVDGIFRREKKNKIFSFTLI